nr:hypothetical protein [uncultured Brumimicrobium sp.]
MRQKPIEKKKRYKFESYIGWNQNCWRYYVQYKEAVDKLVGLVESGTPIDTVSLPLLFLTRHSLELGLKANILRFEGVNADVEKIKLSGSKAHSVEYLFEQFKKHLKVFLKKKVSQETRNKIAEYQKEFESLKKILHDLDKGSFNFRYPFNTSKVSNFEWNDKIQVADIIDMYYKIQPFLLFTENVLIKEGVIEPET